MQNDGTTAKLTNTYLHVDIGSTPLPTPLPQATTGPVPTLNPATCYDAMAFIADISVPDGTVMNPGEDFDKTWRLKNTGSCSWDSSYRLTFVQGDPMGGQPTAVAGTIKPGQTYDMTIDQTAPTTPGKYGGLWQIVNGKNVPFGTRVWIKIQVAGEQPPKPVSPTSTAIPGVQPTSAAAPVIEYFESSADSVAKGGVITLEWSFSGKDLVSAKLTRTNPDGSQTPLYGGADVTNPGTYEDLAANPGTFTYSLAVSSEYGGTTVDSVVVTVNP
jgi:hypothetical protein